MANVIKKATNKFTKGLVMDFSPENTKNEVLTHALNATLLTFNGNEMSLQNDMGNARVETAYLPEGYMPVGTCEYGGIIYIVSYNPLEDKSQIGCFPSPERNISSDEIGRPKASISREDFQKVDNNGPTGVLEHNTKYVLLKNDNLNPGDKFLICSNQSIYNEKLENLLVKKDPKHNSDAVKDKNGYEIEPHPILALNVVSIEESGKIVYLNSDIRRYDVDNNYEIKDVSYTDTYSYHILGTGGDINGEFDQQAIDIDSYRNALSSGYSVFKSKTSGKLAILAELIMIDSYSVTHSLQPSFDEYDQLVEGKFDVVIHTEVEPRLTKENFNTAPKLRYYYLENSQGYIQYYNSESSTIDNRVLFKKGSNGWENNQEFLNTKLNDIYNNVEGINLDKKLGVYSTFNFPYPETYYGKMVSYSQTETIDGSIYTKFTEGKYHRFSLEQIANNKAYFQTIAKFYKYNPNNEGYKEVEESHDFNQGYTYYVEIPISKYKDAKRDVNYKDPINTLYKLTTSAQIATKTEIENVQIEKFQYEEVNTYLVATEEDKASNKELWIYNEESLKFTSLTGSPQAGVTYYIKKVDRNLVPIGYKVNSDEITGSLYYYPTTKNYEQATEEDRQIYFDFVTYPYDEKKSSYGSPITLYYLEKSTVHKPATQDQIDNRESNNIVLFYNSKYEHVSNITNYQYEGLQLFMVVPIDTFLTEEHFVPNETDNYIYGNEKEDDFEKDDPLYLYTLSNFIPDQSNNEDTYTPYHDVKLGSIQLPSIVYKNGIDLPFKYDYTIVPCMNYGRLDHLAVSNTVDFSKLHAFNQSKVNTWKYRIDDGYLRLTLGSEIYDTYESNKVDGLVLEFYDHRGFAGSLEFTGKKSYNGLFTKIIPLNAFGALSRKKIYNTNYRTDYMHNVNIVYNQKEDRYEFNNKHTEFNPTTGWNLNEEDNDCSVIYSNIIYGVKVYFRRTKDSNYEFINKGNFFIYTLPIYNDYYYKVENFSNLVNPSLQMMLTYKLTDSNSNTVYNIDSKDLVIKNGYTKAHDEIIQSYLSGNYNTSNGTSFDVVKYYQYDGTSNLYLNVGLKSDYNNCNMAYDQAINQYFSCTLKLVSNTDADLSFNVTANTDEVTTTSDILNYKNGNIPESLNYLHFNGKQSEITLSDIFTEDNKNKFYKINFLNIANPQSLSILYKFIVGYKAYVENITKTQIPATTICALCHEQANGEFNYNDFGVYVSDNQFLSSTMMYNTGDMMNEQFGLCKQIRLLGTAEQQLTRSNSYPTKAQKIDSAGELNTSGDALKQIYRQLGKYTFCQPHAHVLDKTNSVNIYKAKEDNPFISGYKRYAIAPEAGRGSGGEDNEGYLVDGGVEFWDYDDCLGLIPSEVMYDNPLYNLSVNTETSVAHSGEFVSVLTQVDTITPTVQFTTYDYGEKQYNVSPGDSAREFTGFTGEQISKFNKALVETMKSIYAYNPDYNQIDVNLGNVTLQKYNPTFNSNLLCIDSKFNFKDKTLNDFIYFGSILVSDYINDLNEYSNSILNDAIVTTYVKEENGVRTIHPIDQLHFIPDYTYCGQSSGYYLITELNYNMPVVTHIQDELQHTKAVNTLVKKSDGKIVQIDGIPDKKTLYGFIEEYNKLIPLDVSNYRILPNGTLEIKNKVAKQFVNVQLDFSSDDLMNLCASGTVAKEIPPQTIISNDGEEMTLKATLNFNIRTSSALASGKPKSILYYSDPDERAMFISQECAELSGCGIRFDVTGTITLSNPNYTATVKEQSVTLKVAGRSFKKSKISDFSNYHEERLWDLMSNTANSASWLNNIESTACQQGYFLTLESNLPVFEQVTITPQIGIQLPGVVPVIRIEPSKWLETEPYIEVYKLDIMNAVAQFTIISNIESIKNSIINVTPTDKYGEFKNDLCYDVLSDYKDTCFIGTNITINDLKYDSNQNPRLFMKNGLYRYGSSYRGQLFYRNLTKPSLDGDQWAITNKEYNRLFFFTGPGFNYNYLK